MHDSIPRKAKVTEEEGRRPEYKRPRKANEYLQMFAGEPPPAMLFDEFWREGELALMFGPSGAGKSLLATQIAEALARGRPIESFNMPTRRQRVLYVDLGLSGRQFDARYGGYRFSENLFRERPETTDKLCEWLRETIAKERFRYVVIDDLAAVRETCDGTRETLKLMRELIQLRDDLDISILVLADCREPRNGVAISERDMLRSRVLCDAADSVFAIAVDPTCPYSRNVLQTRTAYRPAWTAFNAPTCWIKPTGDGLLGLIFDGRFRPQIDDERARLICEIKRRRDAGETYREMAPELGISLATASRLRKKWRPGLDPTASGTGETTPEPPAPAFDENEPPEWEEAGFEKPEWADLETEDYTDDAEPNNRDSDVVTVPNEISDPAIHPPDHTGGNDPPLNTRRSILLALGFRPGHDKNGREIFIERESEEGTRLVWYRFDRKNQHSNEERLVRVEYKVFGDSNTGVDGPICLFNTS